MLSLDFLIQYFDYNLQGILNLAACSISLALGLLVLLKDPRSKIHRCFFLITLTGGIWLFCYAIIYSAAQESSAYSWMAISYLLGVPFISPSVFLFASYLTGKPPRRKTVFFIFGLAVVFALLMFFFPSEICSFQYLKFGRLNLYRSTLFGRAYYFGIVNFFFLVALLSFWKLFSAWKTAPTPGQKLHLRNFIIGFLVGYVGGTSDFLVAGGLPFFHFGFLSFTIFLLIVAYSIARHQFLDINLLIKRFSLISLIYVLLFALLIPILLPAINSVLNQPTQHPHLILGLSIGSGFILSLGPLIYAYLVGHNFWLRSRVSTGLTHELKSPLGSIQSAIGFVIENLDASGDKQKALDYANMVQQNADRLEEYVKNLLNIAKIQDGVITISRGTINLNEIILSILKNYQPLADRKKIAVSTDIDKLPNIVADEEKIQQAFSNIISNAIKYSDGGTVAIRGTAQPDSILFSIADQGRGISKKNLGKIFDRFFQVNSSQKGSGIGLTIAKAWVEAHGGKIWAESEGEGKGTKVTFTLPV